jgi:hypothetical protein
MRWRSKAWDWKRGFAFLPYQVGDEWHWLVPFWRRFRGDCYEVTFTDPGSDVRAA